MAILAVIHLPILIMNTYGTNASINTFYSATMTTFGNLGNAKVIESVNIPGCDDNEFHFEHCEIGQVFTIVCVVIV